MAGELLGQFDLSRPVRLLGLGASSLEPNENPRQLNLEDSPEWDRVEDAVAAVKDKFGDGAVSPARLIDGDAGDKEPS